MQEMADRMRAFEANGKFIEGMNGRTDLSFEVGRNLFSDMFDTEIDAM
jgi:hypothetical protein